MIHHFQTTITAYKTFPISILVRLKVKVGIIYRGTVSPEQGFKEDIVSFYYHTILI